MIDQQIAKAKYFTFAGLSFFLATLASRTSIRLLCNVASYLSIQNTFEESSSSSSRSSISPTYTTTSTTISETLLTFSLQDPYFEPMSNKNITVMVGKSAYLPCKVKRLGGKSVSWIRHRDLHILTVGKYLYTSDERFQPLHKDGSDEWILFIKYAQKRDSGVYECQISTQPIKSIFINLLVVEPVSEISGAPEIFVSQSSNIFLTCTIKYSPSPPEYIRWYHNDRVINYDSPRGGVNVITEKGDVSISYLIIQKAQVSDSGRFYCCPSNARKASVLVHVLQAESPAAMQKGSTATRSPFVDLLVITFSIFLICCNYRLL